MDPNDPNRNLLLAIALSLLVVLGWSYLTPAPEPQDDPTAGNGTQTPATVENGNPSVRPSGDAGVPGPAVPDAGTGTDVAMTREDAINGSARRVTVSGNELTGSINLNGGRFDDVTLLHFRETVDPDSPRISMFSPTGSPNPYFAEFGWVDAENNKHAAGDVLWQARSGDLTPGRPIELSLTDEAGLAFTRRIAIDDEFMFTITDRVENTGSQAATLFPYGLIRKANTPEYTGTYILHVGAIGVLDDTLREVGYDDLREDGPVEYENTSGWLGITDKFWLATMIPTDGIGPFKAAFKHFERQGGDRYQAEYLGQAVELAPGQSTEATVRLFVGAKEITVLNHYEEDLGINRFDMAIDFGWFFFLTKPLLSVLIYFRDLLGNFGLSILLVTVFIKLIFFPLANKSYISMSKMKALQPKIVELRDKYADDKQKMQTELMALYKREKANPVSGCLPIALQIPVFFALYKVLFVSIEMRHAPFFGWIKDLSAPDPTTIANLFGLIPWDPPSWAMLGAWPILMGVTMFAQQKLNPAPPDPMQARVFMLMPIVFTVILAGFPAGLVIYWTWNNLLSMAQQYVIMRRMGVKVGGGKSD